MKDADVESWLYNLLGSNVALWIVVILMVLLSVPSCVEQMEHQTTTEFRLQRLEHPRPHCKGNDE